jgi:hypothetical protein
MFALSIDLHYQIVAHLKLALMADKSSYAKEALNISDCR